MTESRITILTPALLCTAQAAEYFGASMKSLYDSISYRPKHLFSIKSTPQFRLWVNGFLTGIGANFSEVGQGYTALAGFLAMLDNVETDYVYLHLADVQAITNKDFLTPCIQAMDTDPMLVQVRIAGHPFSSGSRNTEPLQSNGREIFFREDPDTRFTPIRTKSGDVVWSSSMAAKNQKMFYAVPIWSTVMRTTYLRTIINTTKEYFLRNTDRTLTHITEHINGAEDLVRYYLPSSGWHPRFKYIEDYKQGCLNFACYIYALGPLREENTIEKFVHTNTREVKEVPPAGDF